MPANDDGLDPQGDGFKPLRRGELDNVDGVNRRLDLLAEQTRTGFDLLTEKLVNGLTTIADRMASIALDVGQLMNERVDNRRRLDDHERRLVALESKPKRASRPRKK